MKKCVVVSVLLVAANLSFGANSYWSSDALGSAVFTLPQNWSPTYTTSSDTLRVGGPTNTYPYSTNLAKLTTVWGAVGSTVNDQLLVGTSLYQGNFELDCGSSTTVYFKNVIVGDTKFDAAQGDGVMTITSGKLSRGLIANDTGYMTVGRNNSTGNNPYYGVAYLYINGGEVNMDRLTVGEKRADADLAGVGHVVLQNNGVIDLPCEKTFAPPAFPYVGFKLNNGDFTWIDNGNSTFKTGFLWVNTGTLIFQSTDNSFGTDGKGIAVNSGMPAGPGTAVFTKNALVDLTRLADTTNWVTLITAAGGITFTDWTLTNAGPATALLTPASIAEGWGYRLLDLDGEVGNATALQVRIQPILTCSANNGVLTVSWSPLYLGWTLQAQTNSPSTSLTTTWAGTDIPGTDLVTSTNISISLDNSAVFFRLRQ